jgi:hypothetical protein
MSIGKLLGGVAVLAQRDSPTTSTTTSSGDQQQQQQQQQREVDIDDLLWLLMRHWCVVRRHRAALAVTAAAVPLVTVTAATTSNTSNAAVTGSADSDSKAAAYDDKTTTSTTNSNSGSNSTSSSSAVGPLFSLDRFTAVDAAFVKAAGAAAALPPADALEVNTAYMYTCTACSCVDKQRSSTPHCTITSRDCSSSVAYFCYCIVLCIHSLHHTKLTSFHFVRNAVVTYHTAQITCETYLRALELQHATTASGNVQLTAVQAAAKALQQGPRLLWDISGYRHGGYMNSGFSSAPSSALAVPPAVAVVGDNVCGARSALLQVRCLLYSLHHAKCKCSAVDAYTT